MNKRLLLGVVAFVVGALAFANFWLYPDTVVPIWISHPIGIIAMGYVVIGVVVPAMIGRSRPQDPPVTPPVATARCGGHVGLMRFSGPLIRVTVYADRLTLKLFLMREYTIMGPEIHNVTMMRWRQLVVEHSAGRASPVRLQGLSDQVVAAVLRINRDDQRAARRSRMS